LGDCSERFSFYPEIERINHLDGFALQPRIRVVFSAQVNTDTLRDGIFIVSLDQPDRLVSVNELVYDLDTNTVYARPDELLGQTGRYALIVTTGVRDTRGDPVEREAGFDACLNALIGGEYCVQLGRAIRSLEPRLAPRVIVGGSVFTTMSATAFMEEARAQLENSSVTIARPGPRNVFQLDDLVSVTHRQQTRVDGQQPLVAALPRSPAQLLAAGAGRIAFASFQSPHFLDDTHRIPVTPTGEDVPMPASTREIHLFAVLPASPPPPGGYPVVIGGHGITAARVGIPSFGAAALAPAGFAIVGISAYGHGYGPDTKAIIVDKSGVTTELPAGGRGVDLNGDGLIGPSEGCVVGDLPYDVGDCARQTALDLMQLVRLLRAGVDLDGDGVVDLDGGRISYVGQSFGANNGSIFVGLETGIQSAVMNVGGSTYTQISRLAENYRPGLARVLAARGMSNAGADFDDDLPLRDQPVRVNRVPGAIEIQDYLSLLEWIETPSAPTSFALLLRASPERKVLYQIATGDRSMPNPVNSALIRAADAKTMTTVYRHDLARSADGRLPLDPHRFLTTLSDPASAVVSAAAFQQVALFLSTPSSQPPDVNHLLKPFFGRDLFEVPAVLPEELNFLLQ
jgi:hypothetical protein